MSSPRVIDPTMNSQSGSYSAAISDSRRPTMGASASRRAPITMASPWAITAISDAPG